MNSFMPCKLYIFMICQSSGRWPISIIGLGHLPLAYTRPKAARQNYSFQSLPLQFLMKDYCCVQTSRCRCKTTRVSSADHSSCRTFLARTTCPIPQLTIALKGNQRKLQQNRDKLSLISQGWHPMGILKHADRNFSGFYPGTIFSNSDKRSPTLSFTEIRCALSYNLNNASWFWSAPPLQLSQIPQNGL